MWIIGLWHKAGWLWFYEYMCVCAHTHTHTHIYMSVCVHIQTCIHILIYIYIRIWMHVCMCSSTHTHTHTHTYIYIYIYIYIYMCVCVCIRNFVNCARWWNPGFGELGDVKCPFVAITPTSILTCSRSTIFDPISESKKNPKKLIPSCIFSRLLWPFTSWYYLVPFLLAPLPSYRRRVS